jgi:hypothetical protein
VLLQALAAVLAGMAAVLLLPAVYSNLLVRQSNAEAAEQQGSSIKDKQCRLLQQSEYEKH